jgi:Tol biopolymer transport system component
VFVRDRKLGTTERVSVGPDGEQANGNSDRALITPDGRFVAFASDATNLVVPHDTARLTDVFVRDRRAGTTTRVSGRPNGLEADGGSYGPAISADGRFVAFGSYATNLVPHDTNGTNDIFVHDQQTGRTERVSLGQGGAQANGDSYDTAISADGRFVAFDSSASNLVPHDTNGAGCGSDPECGQDVFVRDRRLHTTERVSLRPNGRQYVLPSELVDISADGRLVAFDALFPRPPISVPRGATGLVRDRQTGRTTVVYRGEDGCDNGLTAISPDGRVVTFGTGCGASEWFQLYVRERP